MNFIGKVASAARRELLEFSGFAHVGHLDHDVSMTSHEDILQAVRRIPVGRVSTYGRIARVARLPHGARQVGYALAGLHEDSDVPWHRVVNARGAISRRSGGSAFERLQHAMLEREGVSFGPGGRIDLERFGWP
jgi:methylated-DNA-protein-cysteine methyltransferase-like protein